MDKAPLPDNNQNTLFPVFLKLSDFKLLIVGGGNVALEKLNSILSNSPQANITLIAPVIKTEIWRLCQSLPAVQIIERKFEPEDLNDKSLIICATDDFALHRNIKSLAANQYKLVNVADTPDLCDFYLASIVQKGNLKIAISSNGLSPTGAKRIKEALHEALPESLDKVLIDLNRIRNNLKGDFAYKIKRMNEVTAPLVLSSKGIQKKKQALILLYILTIILSLIVGYCLGYIKLE
jgi:siroheme synthase-like protein